MSIFEAMMLVCFGAAWPFSIWRSYRSRQNAGKSVIFLVIVFFGYIAGIIHKVIYNLDLVTILYALNAAMVAADIGIYYRNKKLATGKL
ncbi:MAG: hypothetical protein PHF37_08430 [Phycisphaerae bacterium]|nr:hypothetical protein [Phycisphaerae bacterium]